MKHSKIQNQSVNKGKYAGNVNTVSQQKSCCYRFFNGCKPGWYGYNAKAHIHKNIPPNPETVCYYPNVMVPEINKYAKCTFQRVANYHAHILPYLKYVMHQNRKMHNKIL